MAKLCVINWNIGNSTIERFTKQFAFMLIRNPDVIVLTEIGSASKIENLKKEIEGKKYKLYSNNCYFDKYAVVILIKEKFDCEVIKADLSDSRNLAINLNVDNVIITVIGTYYPSNNRKLIEKKKIHHERFIKLLDSVQKDKTIIFGDFNSVKIDHFPRFKWFRSWEYAIFDDIEKRNFVDSCTITKTIHHSWFGNTGLGHLYDYCFLSDSFSNGLLTCNYEHEVVNWKLSDHALQYVEFFIRENIHV